MSHQPFIEDPAAFTNEWMRHLHNIRAGIVVFTDALSVDNPHADSFSEFFTRVHLAGRDAIAWELAHPGESVSRGGFISTATQLDQLLITDEERKRLEDLTNG